MLNPMETTPLNTGLTLLTMSQGSSRGRTQHSEESSPHPSSISSGNWPLTPLLKSLKELLTWLQSRLTIRSHQPSLPTNPLRLLPTTTPHSQPQSLKSPHSIRICASPLQWTTIGILLPTRTRKIWQARGSERNWMLLILNPPIAQLMTKMKNSINHPKEQHSSLNLWRALELRNMRDYPAESKARDPLGPRPL